MKQNYITILKMAAGPKIIATYQNYRKRYHQKLSLEQLQEISLLMNCGYSIKETIELLNEDNDQCIYSKIHQRLLKSELFEDVIKDYINHKYLKNYIKFSAYFSFDKALEISNSIYHKQNKIIENLLKPIIYPMFIFISSLIGLTIFYFYAFDLLINFIIGLNLELGNIYIIKNIIGLILLTILSSVVIIIIMIFVMTRKKYIVLSYIIINRHLKIEVLTRWLSYQFIIYYQILYQSGLSTQKVLQIIKSSNDALMAFQSYHVEKMLTKGCDMATSMNNNYLDKYLSRYIRLGVNTNNLSEVLNNYILKSEKNFNDFIKRLSLSLQVISYILIGIIVIFIYQIIMMPIGIIENI